MNAIKWSLVFQLSLFGLAMAIATVFWIPWSVEPFFWLVIFLLCSYIIAIKCSGKFFIHGLLVSILNSIWITVAHVILFETYLANHSQEAAMMNASLMPLSPRIMMLIGGPVIGIISGLILGLFAVSASNIVKIR